jgi:hypothetical protein
MKVYAGHEFIFKTGEPATAFNIVTKGLVICKVGWCKFKLVG